MNYNKSDKVKIVIDIIKKLKKFPSTYNGEIDIYNEQYSYYDEFKNVTNKWINTDKIELKGTIEFYELNTNFEYYFPMNKTEEPLFVLRRCTRRSV